MTETSITQSELRSGNSIARATLVFAGLAALVVLSYFFLDRQVAEALHPYTHGVRFFIWLTKIVGPITPLASIAAAFVAARALTRGSLTPTESAILRLCCAILLAGVLTYELKFAFGRTWPETYIDNNPSYFGNGTYGFFPFHPGRAYESFPSGHTTAVSAIAGALWTLGPKLRWLGVALVLAVVIGLLGADFHWLSDILAGGIVGGSTGLAAARIGRSRDPGAA
jgi:membrane-associated phospholipid phosphatase